MSPEPNDETPVTPPPAAGAAPAESLTSAHALVEGADGHGIDGAVGDPDAGPAPMPEDLTALLEAARAEAARSHDRYLRAAADLDNFRKRTVKMRSEARDETLRDVLLQVAPVLDNMRRALADDTDDAAALRRGVDIILNQFNDILRGYGLQEIAAEGQPFDPNLHEALVQVPTDEHPPGTVIQEMERGYKLNDRVVRPARVVVSMARDQTPSGTEGKA